MANCTVSGTFTNSQGTAVSGATVRFNTQKPLLDLSGNLIMPKEITTTTATDGSWSLSIIQSIDGTLTLDLNPSSNAPIVKYTFSLIIPATTTATFASCWVDSGSFGGQSASSPLTFASISGQMSTAQLPVETSGNVLVGNGTGMSSVTMSGDASITSLGAVTVGSVGASTAANIHSAEVAANAATNANTASTIVKRDASGNFSAGTITGSLTGHASLDLQASNNLSDVVSPSAARTSLGLGNAATQNVANLTESTSAVLTITNGAASVLGSGTTIQVQKATASVPGYLDSTDFTTFNNKQSTTLTTNHILVGSAGGVATDVSMSGDATIVASGATTLATVNSNVGSFGTASQVPTLTVNAKGLTTAASNTSIQIAESQVTGLVADLAAKQSTTLTTNHILVGAAGVAADVAMSGDATIAAGGALTLATVATAGTSTKVTYNVKGLVTSGASATLASSDFANQGTTTTVLHGNASGNPSFGAVSLTTDVTGTLPLGNGGTGQTTKAAAFDALSPMSAGGDIIYGGTSGTGTRLAKGADGTVLTLASGVPSWAASAGSSAVGAFYYANANKTISSTQPFDFNTSIYDTNSAVTTGSSWKFTAPSTGNYSVQVWLNNGPAGGTTEGFRIYKNGSLYSVIGISNVSTTAPSMCGMVVLSATDYMDIRGNTSDTFGGGTFPGASASWISITKVG